MNSQKKKNQKKILQFTTIVVLSLFIGIQFMGKDIENIKGEPVTGLPEPVHEVLERSCFNCHSSASDLAWIDKVAPVSWVVNSDIRKARAAMNISQWKDLSPAALKGQLWAVLNMIKSRKMPLKHYLIAHPEAEITQADIQTIETYVRSLDQKNIFKDTLSKKNANKEFDVWKSIQEKVTKQAVSPNGVIYREDFKSWKVMGITTLYDNTMRVTYANAIAVKALKEKKINPFPDGAIVAKAVWEQVKGKYGEIVPGKFVNVQIMEKDVQKYKNTEGWGFAKFSSLKLEPFGETADFAATSCISCHRLRAKKSGYLFNIPLETKQPIKTTP